MTKMGEKRIHLVRGRGANMKFRAIRLETGNFSWGTESISRKTRLMDVVYNASNNELVRTKTLVKNAVVVIDATPFRVWYEQYYGEALGKNLKEEEQAVLEKKSSNVERKREKRSTNHEIDPKLAEQFASGRLYACISSRPGQSGRADGYILEGKELEFYLRKITKKK